MYIKNSEYLSKYTGAEIDEAISGMSGVEAELEGKVDKTQTINGKELTGDITITANDVGALSSSREINGHPLTSDITLTASDVGAVPVTRTINDKSLEENITLTASDVEAVPVTREINGHSLTSDITLTASDVEAVPVTRTINGKSLEENITLTAGDVGAITSSDVGDATVTFTQGGVLKGSITMNQKTATTIALDAGGGTGGSSTLSGLEDVSLDLPKTGQALVYDEEDQLWKNGDASSVVFVDWTTGDNNTIIFIEDPIVGTNQFRRLLMTGDTSWILLKDGTLYGCGCNESGQQGTGDLNDMTSFTQRLTNVKEVYADNNVTWALKDDNTLWGCGENNDYQQGSSPNTDIKVFTQRIDDVKQVLLGEGFIYVLKKDGTIWNCGYYTEVRPYSSNNTYSVYNLHYNSFHNASSKYSGGTEHDFSRMYLMDECLYGVEDSGKLKVRGYSPCGALGIGTYMGGTTSIDSDIQYDGYFHEVLPTNIKDISLAHGIAWVLTEDGRAYRTGNNEYGNLGTGEFGTVLRDFTLLDDLDNIKKIVCSEKTTFILTDDGKVYSCGSDDCKQLGNGSYESDKNVFEEVKTHSGSSEQTFSTHNIAKDISCASNCSWILTTSNDLYSCGSNLYGNFGYGSSDNVNLDYFEKRISNVKSFYADNYVTWVLKNDGTLWGCGYNEYGSQGSGDTNNVTVFTQRLENVESFSCSRFYTQAVKTDGTMWMCGKNDYGQQGSGNTDNVLEFTKRVQPIQ